MRIFQNFQEAYPEILRDIVKFGVLVKSKTQQDKDVSHTDKWHSKELQCYSFGVIDTSDSLAQSKDPEWCQLEIKERLNMEAPFVNPGTAYKKREYWDSYLYHNNHGDSRFPYTYNERIGPYLMDVINLLKSNPDTRQAIINLFIQSHDIKGVNGKFRIPCSIFYHFMYRQEKLDIIYTMRSCDYYEHFRNDCHLACELRNFIAEQCGMEPGKFFMNINSLHVYKKDAPEEYQMF
jgi:thymidylate synthase